MDPLVSICIPCHNAKSYVAETLESALAQTWPQTEIVVVDDASNDGSAEIVQQFESKGVQLIRAELHSAAKARNLAAQHSAGDMIKFLDADDLLSPESVAAQVDRIGAERDVIASGRWGRFENDPSMIRLNPEAVWRDLSGTDWLIQSWRNARSMTQPGIFLIPRQVWDKAGPWNEKLGLIDDFEFFSRVIGQAREVRFTESSLLYYRSNLDTSLSGRKDREAVESAYQSLILGTANLLAIRQDKEAKLSCANLLQDFIFTYYPEHQDLLEKMEEKVSALGGASVAPAGGTRFQALARIMGWKMARRIEHILRP